MAQAQKAPAPRSRAASRRKDSAPPAPPEAGHGAHSEYPVEESAILLMRIAVHGWRRNFTGHLAEFGVPFSVWYFLRILWDDDGLSQKDLTRRAGMLQPNAVSAIRTMEELGLARVERESGDRRRIRVWLTQKARDLEHKILPRIREDTEQTVFKDFTAEERHTLTRLLGKVCANITGSASSD
ncbi:transcriptional regulator SlyA [Pigmentiphaga humi]|uniref:Transcriptional regulator SlyA n=1 Tax=Pigmentiphaga humi TaxID=2478468 RepID=A0A3P4AYI8_9BURK|nr:transcriptional regulator SlyA [Pigmentiphaga humi]